jgi:uncharacterized paraquat-inducible protein A
MRIITHTYSNCGTVVAANELESRRLAKCPRLTCESLRRLDDLPERERCYFLEHRDQHRL